MTEQITTSIEAGNFNMLNLRVKVPAHVVSKAYERVLRDQRHRIQVAGYRVGKAPIAAVRKELGSKYLGQLVAQQLVKDNANEAARQQGLPPVGRSPEAYTTNHVVEGQEFEFLVRLNSIRVKVIKLDPAYETMTVAMPRPRDVDEQLAEQLEEFRLQHAERRVRGANEKAEKNDRVTFSCVVIDEHQPQPQEFEGGKEQSRIIGKDSMPGLIERSIEGMCSGDTRRIARIIRQDYDWCDEDAHLEGMKVTFDLKVHKIEQLLLPELTDALVQRKTGTIPSVTRLKNKMRQEIEDADRDRRYSHVENHIEGVLLAGSEIEIPPLLIDRVSELIYNQRKPDGEISEGQQAALRHQCRDLVQGALASAALLEEVARRLGIEVPPQNPDPRQQQQNFIKMRRELADHYMWKTLNNAISSVNEKNEEEEGDEAVDVVPYIYKLHDKIIAGSELLKLAPYIGLELEVEQVTAADVDQRLDFMRLKSASYQLSDAVFTGERGQRIEVTRHVTIDGKLIPDLTLERTTMSPVQSMTASGDLPAHFQVFVGMRPGEKKQITRSAEDSPEAGTQVGEVVITAQLHEMQEMSFPALDDQFAQEFYDSESIVALRDSIMQSEKRERAEEARTSIPDVLGLIRVGSEFRIDEDALEVTVAHIMGDETLLRSFTMPAEDCEDKEKFVRDAVTKIVQHRMVAEEIARRENIAYNKESDHKNEQMLANVMKFLGENAKIVEVANESTEEEANVLPLT